MFNFFSEIKKGVKNYDLAKGFNMVNISNHIVYVEGHKGITFFSCDCVCFKVKDGRLTIEGDNLLVEELSTDTLKISGDIKKIEAI